MRNYFVLLFLAVFLSACGGGSGSGSNRVGSTIPVGSVSGTVLNGGFIANANVNVYDYTTGAKGALLAHAASDSKGQYSLPLQVESRPILLEITDGTYTEQGGVANAITLNATGSPYRKLSAVTYYTTGSTVKIAITSFTHMAAGLAAYEISKRTSVAIAIADANKRVSALSGFDILATMPVQVIDQATANTNLPPALKYGFWEAGISMWTNNNAAPIASAHIAPYTSIDFAQVLYQDISADGLLDGVGLDATGKPAPLTLGTVPLSVNVYRLGLGVSMIQMAAVPANLSGVTGPGLLAYAQAYVGSTDAMFNNVTPLPIPSPTSVSITPPANNGWARRVTTVNAATTDTVGISAVDILVDGVAVTASRFSVTPSAPPTYQAAPGLSLNTANYLDGVHTIGVRTTNLAGLTTTSSIQLKIDNTAPTTTIGQHAYPVWTGSCGLFSCSSWISYWVYDYILGTALDAAPATSPTAAPSGVLNIKVLPTGTPVAPAAGGAWSIAGNYAGSTVRVTDVAGNCTDYKDTAGNWTWSTVVLGACP